MIHSVRGNSVKTLVLRKRDPTLNTYHGCI